MRTLKHINFLPGIRYVSQKSFVDAPLHLNARAAKIMEKILIYLNYKLVDSCRKKFKPTKRNNVMRASVAFNVVDHLFSGQLKHHAVAEGNRCILRFQTGLLNYKPKSKAAARRKKRGKVKKEIGPEFCKGVTTIAKSSFPDITVQRKEKQLVCKMLGDLAKKICDETKTSAETANSLGANHVQTAIGKIMTENIRRHADAEGTKMICFLEAGKIFLDHPRKRRAKTPSRAAPTKRRRRTPTKTAKRKRIISKTKTPSRKAPTKTRGCKSPNISRRKMIRSKSKKIRNKKPVNFLPGIRYVSQKSFVDTPLHLNARAAKRMEKILRNLNDKLVDSCQKKFKPTKRNNVISASVAFNVVDHLFSGQLKHHAVAEGNRCILRFQTGLLNYKPKSKAAARSKKRGKVKKEIGPEFCKGVTTIAKSEFPDITVQRKEKQLLCKMLGDLAKKMCEEAKTSAKTVNSLGANHVQTATGKIMTENIRRHADAEGTKMMCLLEAGKIFLDHPRKRRAKTPSRTAPTKRRRSTPTKTAKRKRIISKTKTPSRKVPTKTRGRKSPKISRRKRIRSKSTTPLKTARTKRRRLQVSEPRKASVKSRVRRPRTAPILKPKQTVRKIRKSSVARKRRPEARLKHVHQHRRFQD